MPLPREKFSEQQFFYCSIGWHCCLYFYLNYEILGAVQIVVYVGGIVVLLIFSIFLTSDAGSDMKKPTFLRAFFSALAASCGTALVCTVYAWHHFTMSTSSVMEPTARNIGRLMLSTGDKGYMFAV
ncbi:MAG: NADH-quinone oxidoreductase subunit J [Crocinitomicaceae bacterium]|nr:NADH-quinone oxidoreductase subunit J [Crocinitomicaceae bacterium]